MDYHLSLPKPSIPSEKRLREILRTCRDTFKGRKHSPKGRATCSFS